MLLWEYQYVLIFTTFIIVIARSSNPRSYSFISALIFFCLYSGASIYTQYFAVDDSAFRPVSSVDLVILFVFIALWLYPVIFSTKA